MAEAFALGASIIAVIQLGDRVISLCRQFIGKVRGAEREVAQIISTITALNVYLEFLEKLVSDDCNSRLPQLNSIFQPGGPLAMCKALLKDMESKLQPKRDYNGVLKAITWPWKWKDIGEALEVIERQKTLIMLALQSDNTQTTLAIETEIKRHVQDKTHKDILQWLTKVDPTSNHITACEKHEPGTGEWFINSREFSYWMLPGRSLWLHGIPGAGKTVLFSTIVENVKSRCSSQSRCIYFYFDFSDPSKQKVVNMLYSFLSQLSIEHIHSDIRQLYESCGKGTREASIPQLTATLLAIIRDINSIYILVDALDESSERGALLDSIKTMCQSDNINMLVTSRNEDDLNATITSSMTYVIPIQNEHVDMDIQVHVERCLKNDRVLSVWDDDLKSAMARTLVSKARGM